MLPLSLQSRESKINWLESSIAKLKEAGRPTQYLEELLIKYQPRQDATVNLYNEDYNTQFEPIFSKRELAQMHTFGYVIDSNPSVNKNALRTTQAYQIARKHGQYLGF